MWCQNFFRHKIVIRSQVVKSWKFRKRFPNISNFKSDCLYFDWISAGQQKQAHQLTQFSVINFGNFLAWKCFYRNSNIGIFWEIFGEFLGHKEKTLLNCWAQKLAENWVDGKVNRKIFQIKISRKITWKTKTSFKSWKKC